MANLRVSNANITTAQTGTLTANGLNFGSSITIGNSSINSTSISVGNTTVNSTTLSTPSLVLGGVAYTSLISTVGIVNTQIFTANGTWTNPISNTSLGLDGNSQVFIMMWGGGGEARETGAYGGDYNTGGGGACVIHQFSLGLCNAVCNVVIGGNEGGNSVFFANTSFSIIAYGGGNENGGGGGWLGRGNTASGGDPLGSLNRDSTFGGGDNFGFSSIYGGGGGTTNGNRGGTSIFGGAGGSVGNIVTTSVFGGAGGNNSVEASAPGGGGGGITGDGARGEVRIWVLK